MKNIKSKFVSLLVMSYAFTSLNASAQLTVIDGGLDSIGNSGSDMKAEIDAISYVRNRPVLLSEFDDGSELSWVSKNDVELYGDKKMPIGFNSSGLIIKSIEDGVNTYSDSEDVVDIQVSTKDFPLWALSKYNDIESVKEGVKNIVISKNKNDKPLSYEIIDKNENVIFLKSVNGDLKVS